MKENGFLKTRLWLLEIPKGAHHSLKRDYLKGKKVNIGGESLFLERERDYQGENNQGENNQGENNQGENNQGENNQNFLVEKDGNIQLSHG